MLNKLKLPVTLLLLACLFMPLSTCTAKVPDPKTGERHESVQYYYAVPDIPEWGALRFMPALLFILPLLLVLQQLFDRNGRLAYDMAGVLLSVLILAYLAFYFYLTRPAPGGYLATASAMAYLALSITGLFQLTRHKKVAGAADSR